MNRHREVNEYLDGRLGPEARHALEQRLATEPDLAAELRDTRALVDLLHDLPVEQAPAGLTGRVMAALDDAPPAPEPRRGAWPRLARWPQLAAVAAILVALAWPRLAGPSSPNPPELSASEQAFIEDCLRDYHYQVAASLGAQRPSGDVTQISLEF